METESNSTSNERSGYVYVASSDCIRVKWKRGGEYDMPYKIGKATDVDSRIGNLNGAVPIDFRVWLTLQTQNMSALENAIHKKLGQYRYPRGEKKTEFFVCELSEIKKAVDCIIKDTALCREMGIGRVIRDVKTAHCGRSAKTIKENRERLYSGAISFICTNRHTHAIGRFVQSEGKLKFKVDAGALCSLTPTPKFQACRPISNYKLWKELISSENRKINDKGELIDEFVFDSPSAAASVITASTRNGNDVWREYRADGSEGKTLGFFLTGKEGRTNSRNH